jgi:AbrB family looped-hinge helix DNA binding protein
MQITRLSSKGQIIIPKKIRSRHKWNPGQELSVIDTGDGILLKPAQTFKKTKLDQVAGILKYSGTPITLEEMEKAIEQGALERKK